MAPVERWCRVRILDPDGTTLASFCFAGPGPPDLGVVHAIARAQLLAGRIGGSVVVDEVSPALRSLLDLAGLAFGAGGAAPPRSPGSGRRRDS
jgi:hypothetical protein